jgi:hypothetical protein
VNLSDHADQLTDNDYTIQIVLNICKSLFENTDWGIVKLEIAESPIIVVK